MIKKFGLLSILFAFVLGCEANIYHDLHEQSANEMIVALESSGIEAGKSPGTSADSWNVHVSPGVRVDALKILAAAGLPKPETKGYDAFYPSEGLIPTADEEHVLQQFAQSQEIRKSLLTVDGVVDAQVNLVLPRRSKLRLNNQTANPARASVVVKHRNTDSPLTIDQVQTMVAGSVRDMKPTDVVVVMTPSIWASKGDIEPAVVSVGPLAVAAGSKTSMQILVSALIGMILLLALALAFVLVRKRR